MSVRDLIPRGRVSNATPTAYRDDDRSPFLSLHREMNRLFDDVFRGFDGRLMPFASPSSLGMAWPNVEIAETDQVITVTAEIPGLDDKDVEILLHEGVLTLKGEKRSEIEDMAKRFSERSYGRFERRIPVGVEVEEDKVEAQFTNGVLRIVLPKSAKAQSQVKRIPISS
ncbi:Hsp20/alpha crystallin family protein [Marinivivus vitaminiproducens]|uniref:Hsp20/alpha crystallin family protein n=1 Tax=Marinivivus vitaminiproducens TaxID=3035935 RepID=UPI0027A68404|nr:Hsp20/alpha crystallin family protein [Geminicoccaceae bacterium SCSIO 64248]